MERFEAALLFVAATPELYGATRYKYNSYVDFIRIGRKLGKSPEEIAKQYLKSYPDCCKLTAPFWQKEGFFSGYQWDDTKFRILKEVGQGEWAVTILIKNSPAVQKFEGGIRLKGGRCNTTSELHSG